MLNFFTNRLYDLSINIFYKYSFFYFYIFALQKNFYSLLKSKNLKISYYNLNTNLIHLKKNQVYIFYNSNKYEVFSLSKILFDLNDLNQDNDDFFNTCLSFDAILYHHHYYLNSIKYFYDKYILFFCKNKSILYKNIISFSLLYKKMNKFLSFMYFLKNKKLYFHFFLKRFYFLSF